MIELMLSLFTLCGKAGANVRFAIHALSAQEFVSPIVVTLVVKVEEFWQSSRVGRYTGFLPCW
jgi:hypothetical protein